MTGMMLGGINLVVLPFPHMTLFYLVFNVIWMVWLGIELWKKKSALHETESQSTLNH
jgi:threonine/homoserine/homoserine lactone efflux protein